MLKKLLSTFKVLQPLTQNPAETEAADAISSPEKTAALLVRLEASIATYAETPNSPRRMMLRSQHGQAMLASRRHAIESESQRVAAATQRDKANGEKNLEKANQAFAGVDRVFLEKKARHLAVLARLEPLEAQLTLAIQGAVDQLSAAQAAFDAAVLKGDEPAEMKAAEKLYEIKARTLNPAGPLQLRLAAIRREEIEAINALAAAEQKKSEANKAILRAQADLALVEYDRQVQALLDAYVAQAIAVGKCSDRVSPSAKIASFEAQVSSGERIVFGGRMDNFSNRHLSAFVVRDMIADMTKEPDLAMLAANVEDIAELPPESDEDRRMSPVPGGLVARADGGFEEASAPFDDVAREQAA